MDRWITLQTRRLQYFERKNHPSGAMEFPGKFCGREWIIRRHLRRGFFSENPAAGFLHSISTKKQGLYTGKTELSTEWEDNFRIRASLLTHED